MELNISTLVIGILTLVAALSLLGTIVGQVTEGGTTYATTDERENAVAGGIINFTFLLNNVYLGIDSVTTVENRTNTFTLATTDLSCGRGQYTVNTVTGNITACQFNTTDGNAASYVNVTYNYKPNQYVDDALGRVMIPIVLLVVAAMLVVFGIRYFFKD